MSAIAILEFSAAMAFACSTSRACTFEINAASALRVASTSDLVFSCARYPLLIMLLRASHSVGNDEVEDLWEDVRTEVKKYQVIQPIEPAKRIIRQSP